MRVNILMSTYNGEKYVETQLDSIFRQSYQDFKIYIRDDASSDNTVSVVENYIKEHQVEDRVRFTKGEHLGFSDSYLYLLRQAKEGDVWVFCDQDDEWMEDKVKLAVDWMEGKPDQSIPLLYVSGFRLGTGDMTDTTLYKYPKRKYTFSRSITSHPYHAFAMTFNRPLYERLIRAHSDMVNNHGWFASMIVAAFGYHHISHQIGLIHRDHKHSVDSVHLLKKLPEVKKLMKGDMFYTRNAKEFQRLFSDELNEEDAKILDMFAHKHYKFSRNVKKAFYPRRWHESILVEIGLRILMLVGKL